VGVVAAARPGAGVDAGGPVAAVAGVVGEAGYGLAKPAVAGPAEDDAAALAGLAGDRAQAGLGGELVGGEVTRADVAELGEDLCGADLSGPREGHDDPPVGQGGDGVLDAAGEPGDLGDQVLEGCGQGAGQLALGVGLGIAGEAGRGGAQAGQESGGGAAAERRPQYWCWPRKAAKRLSPSRAALSGVG
jgi:hypothetical protein